MSKPLEEIRLTIYLAPPGMCGMLPEFPRSFLLPMKEERGKGQEDSLSQAMKGRMWGKKWRIIMMM